MSLPSAQPAWWQRRCGVLGHLLHVPQDALPPMGQKKSSHLAVLLLMLGNLVRLAGIEPTTLGFGVKYSMYFLGQSWIAAEELFG